MVLLVLWLAYGVAVLVGCSKERWSPTDPMVWPPPYDPDKVTIVDRVTIGPDGIRHVPIPTATAVPTATPVPWRHIRRSR